MRISNEGIALIKRFEGLELEAYRDAVGILTIGYGHTGDDVFEGQVINEAEAEAILRRDLDRFEVAVNEGIKADTAQSMFDAFVSLSFNIGSNAFKKSTTLKRHNKKDYTGAAEAITWWNKAGGNVLAGLVRRRAAEEALYLDGLNEVTDDEIEVRRDIEENSPRRSNPMTTRTTAGAGTAGTAGAGAAGAVLLDDDEEVEPEVLEELVEEANDGDAIGEPMIEPDGSIPTSNDDEPAVGDEVSPVDDNPEATADEDEGEATIDEVTEDAEDEAEGTAASDGQETSEGTEVEDGSFMDNFTDQDRTDAIVILAGAIAVIAALYVIAARIDDWRKYRR